MKKFLIVIALLFLISSIVLFLSGFIKMALISGGLFILFIYQLIEHSTMGKTHEYLFQKLKR